MLSFGGQIDGHLALSVSMTGPFGSYFSLRKAFLFVRHFPFWMEARRRFFQHFSTARIVVSF